MNWRIEAEHKFLVDVIIVSFNNAENRENTDRGCKFVFIRDFLFINSVCGSQAAFKIVTK